MPAVDKKLSKVFKKATEIPFDDNSKIILMSDCHRSDGTWSDNFFKNRNAFIAALNHYLYNGFTYVEIGDGDELWGNKNPTDIIREHLDSFLVMAKFHHLGRLYLIYGNHDMCKRNCKLVRRKYYKYYDKDLKHEVSIFDNAEVHEGLILKHNDKGYKIFLVHGHQGDFWNDKMWIVSRFLFRHIWKGLELFGVHDPTSAARNYRLKNKTEKKLQAWSDKEHQMIITGHTHRPVLSKNKESLYFNTGSCVHPSGITGIEIENGKITLVKWSTKSNKDGFLYIGRDILEDSVSLMNYIN